MLAYCRGTVSHAHVNTVVVPSCLAVISSLQLQKFQPYILVQNLSVSKTLKGQKSLLGNICKYTRRIAAGCIKGKTRTCALNPLLLRLLFPDCAESNAPLHHSQTSSGDSDVGETFRQEMSLRDGTESDLRRSGPRDASRGINGPVALV